MRTVPRLLAAATVLAAAAAAPSRAADPPFALRDGDRVVFLGDSITEAQKYTRYVEQFTACRYPEADVRFYNAGWGGDTAQRARARVARDVLELKPTVVTVCFGMNDGGYRPAEPQTVATFRENLTAVVAELKAKGARVVVLSPPCVDESARPNLAQSRYNETLEVLTKASQDVAKAAAVPFVDVFHPTRDYLQARRSAGLTDPIVPDGVHPNDEGHLFLAATIVKGLGAEPVPPIGTIDVATGKGRGLEVASKDGGSWTLRCTEPVRVPFWWAPASEKTARASGLADLAALRITVGGLPAATWEVTLDDVPAGSFPSAELARGVALDVGDTPRGKAVHDFVQQREASYARLWRDVRIGAADIPGVGRAVEGLLALDEGYHFRTRDAAKPAAGAVIRLSRAPEGDNLALGKKYDCSDANGRGFGQGGLTDGSWEADQRHCFATGNAGEFPKTVTVDLEKAQRVNAVRVGAPKFGSTRLVKVSVSQFGKEWNEVGSVEFVQKRDDRRTISFAPATARYVRLTYVNTWPEPVQFPPEFCFTTELEVYGPR